MTKPFITLLLCLMAGFASFGQEPLGNKKYKIESINISVGLGRSTQEATFIGDFQRLNPTSKLAFDDLSAYTTNSFGRIESGILSARIILAPTNWREQNKILRTTFRIGLNHTSHTPLSLAYYRSETGPYDRLVSANTGKVYFIDSTRYSSYNFTYNSNITTLDLGIQLNTNYDKRWSYFGGLSVNLGVMSGAASYSKFVQTTYRNRDNYFDSDLYYHDSQERESNFEFFNREKAMVIGVSVPIGIQFRIAKTNRFLNRLRLSAAFTPSYVGYKIRNYGTVGTFTFSRTLGIQFDF